MEDLERLAEQVAMLWTLQMIMEIEGIDFDTPLMKRVLSLSKSEFEVFSDTLRDKLKSMRGY